MSQLFETFQCGDGEALVTFVYGESSPAERETIANHIARCAACAEEVEALGSTRQQLAAWVPPAQTLGFRLTEGAVEPGHVGTRAPTDVLRPAAWWKQPLPAWAQMAAAVLIFASGLGLGAWWTAPLPGAQPVSVAADRQVAATAAAIAPTSASTGVTRQDLAQIEQRLRAEMAQLRTDAPAAGNPDSRAVLQQVRQMIAASEARQLNELELRTSVMTRDWSNRRVLDLANIEKRLGSTAVRVLNNQQDINSLAQRVNYAPSYSPYVP